MAFSRMLMASLLVSFLLLNLTQAAHHMMDIDNIGAAAPSPSPLPQTPINCGVACEGRCKLSSRPNLCKRACGSCCFKCKCVPPGTSGNHNACPCYANLTTRNNLHKCP